MGLISVYSRSPISHQFTILDENGSETFHVIEGTNKHGSLLGLATILPNTKFDNRKIPRITQMEQSIFDKIKSAYKAHVTLFGGKMANGSKCDPVIYTAKNDPDAHKMFEDYKPIITDNQMAIKTKNIELNKAME